MADKLNLDLELDLEDTSTQTNSIGISPLIDNLGERFKKNSNEKENLNFKFNSNYDQTSNPKDISQFEDLVLDSPLTNKVGFLNDKSNNSKGPNPKIPTWNSVNNLDSIKDKNSTNKQFDQIEVNPLLSLEENKAKILAVLKQNQQIKDSVPNMIDMNSFKDGPLISWRDEAISGNFMPAMIMLERRQIHIDDIVNPENNERLIHLAVTYSYLNVTRCLVEKFGANVNIQNKFGHTPLHIISNNITQDLFLLCYFLNIERLNIEVKDTTNVTPLFYTAMSGFYPALLALTAKGANIGHIDGFNNSIMYIIISFGNKFAFKFISNHSKNFNINAMYFNNENSLSDVLINSKHTNICKFIMKYYHNQLSISSLLHANKDISTFKSLNYFNYELMKTVYFYKCFGSIFGLFKLMVSLRTFTYKYYMLTFYLYNLVIKNTSGILKYPLVSVFCLYKTYVFWSYFQYFFDSKEYYTEKLISLESFGLIFQLSSIITIGISLSKFIHIWLVGSNNIDQAQKYSLYSEDKENIIHKVKFALENEPLNFPLQPDICEVCLIMKSKNMTHCSSCNRCVEGFHLHSNFLNVCISNSTSLFYVMLLNSISALCYSIIYYMYLIMDIEYKKIRSLMTLYHSEYFTYNFVIFLSKTDWIQFFIVCYLILLCIYLNQICFCFLISYGNKSTYHYLWKLHKSNSTLNLKLRQNKLLPCNTPPGPSIGFIKFLKNMCLSNECNSD